MLTIREAWIRDTFYSDEGRVSMLRKLKMRRRQQQLEARRKLSICMKTPYGNYDIFHRAIKPYIFVAHLFGVMPLVNTLSSNPDRLEFRVHSIAMLFTAGFLFFGGWRTLKLAGVLLSTGITTQNIVSLLFFIINITICIKFIFLARKWPALIRYWTRMELIFLLPPYDNARRSLQHTLKVIGLTFGFIALLEHSMFYASRYYNYRMEVLHCRANSSRPSFSAFITDFQFRDVFEEFQFNILSAACAFFFNAAFTFVWSYLDLFIMLVSLGLARRFQQFAARVEALTGHYVPDATWCKIRQHHTQLCELMDRVDEHLSGFVLVSSLNNMYFICIQLFNIFTILRYPINYVYRWFSLCFLIFRIASVYLCAAEIHDASVMPLRVLYLVPTERFNEEVQRFVSQILHENIGLTGKRFYLVTRKSLFGFAATIITYEFMLLQFDAQSKKAGLPALCA